MRQTYIKRTIACVIVLLASFGLWVIDVELFDDGVISQTVAGTVAVVLAITVVAVIVGAAYNVGGWMESTTDG